MSVMDRKQTGANRLEALKGLSLFAGLSRKELEFVATRTDQVTVPAGEVLIREGQPNHTFFLLLDGSVDITRAGREVVRHGPGDFFGEISMVERDVATATVTTKAESTLLVMSHQQFRDAVSADDDILAPVLRAMAERMPGAGQDPA